MKTNSMHKYGVVAPAILWLAFSAGALAQTGVPGVLVLRDGLRREGNIRWMGVARQYEVIMPSGVSLRHRPDEVAEVQVRRPAGIEDAVNAVRRGQPDAAIPVLDRIAQSYAMLQWDIPATRWLAEAHLQKNDAAAAVRVCERVTSNRPEAAYASEMAVPYWQALLKSGRTARLSDLLDQAMGTGSRGAVARALVMRGDLLRDRGDLRDALKDGYLRVVLLMRGERDLRAESLYKAIQCFEELGEISYAEQMRRMLISEHGGSEFARRVQAGG